MSLDPRYSPDGLWFWDGRQWVPAAAPGAPNGQPLSAGGASATYVNAGFWLRFVAWFIDTIALSVAGQVVGLFVGFLGGFLDATAGTKGTFTNLAYVFLFAVQLVGYWLYFALMESSSWQATLGKRAIGIKVVDYDYNRISFGRATGRYWAKLISGLICFVGYFMAGFTERKQGLHDVMAGTLVVRRDPVYAYPGQPLPAPSAGSQVPTIAIAVAGGAMILVLGSIVVVVILLTMGGQISNVFSNVTVALNGG